MADAVTFKWDDRKVRTKLEKLGLTAPEILGRSFYTDAELILTEIKAGPVPVDQSTLKDSGYVTPPAVEPPDKVSVTIGFGGAAAAYAHYQEEGVSRFTGKPLQYQRPSAEAHFLTGPVDAHRDEVLAHGREALLAAVEALDGS